MSVTDIQIMSKAEKFFLSGLIVSLLTFFYIYFSPGENTGMGPSPEFWIISTAAVAAIIFTVLVIAAFLIRIFGRSLGHVHDKTSGR